MGSQRNLGPCYIYGGRVDLKKRKSMPIFVILLILAFTITGCRNKSNSKDVVIECFNKIQQGDFNEIGEYMVDFSQEDTNIIDDRNEIFNEALKKLKYDILDTTQEGESAEMNVSITIPNMLELNSRLMRLSVEGIIAGNDIESEEFKQKLKEDIDLDSLDMISSEIKVNLKKVGGKWLIANGEEFLDAVTGNMFENIKDHQNLGARH